MTRPTFLFIGPDKCGSSWMYHILSLHPHCFVPSAKDIYFFDRYYTKGLDWYFSHFTDAPADARAVGELSHDYLFSPIAAQRIYQDLSDVQLFVCLRDPIARSLSQYQYLRRGGEVSGSFEAAVQKFPKIVGNSCYMSHLRHYLDLFGRDRLNFLVFEDLIAGPRAFGRDLLRRLGLRDDIDLPFEDRVREAGMARSAVLSRGLKAGANIARNLGLSNFVGRVKNSRTAMLAYRDIKSEEKVSLTDAQEQALWERYFASENEALSELVGRDLSYWNPAENNK